MLSLKEPSCSLVSRPDRTYVKSGMSPTNARFHMRSIGAYDFDVHPNRSLSVSKEHSFDSASCERYSLGLGLWCVLSVFKGRGSGLLCRASVSSRIAVTFAISRAATSGLSRA